MKPDDKAKYHLRNHPTGLSWGDMTAKLGYFAQLTLINIEGNL